MKNNSNDVPSGKRLKKMREDSGIEPDWQNLRSISKDEFLTALDMLSLSQPAAAKYLGVSQRQVEKWIHGEAKVPTAVVLLLNVLIYYNEKPIFPKYP